MTTLSKFAPWRSRSRRHTERPSWPSYPFLSFGGYFTNEYYVARVHQVHHGQGFRVPLTSDILYYKMRTLLTDISMISWPKIRNDCRILEHGVRVMFQLWTWGTAPMYMRYTRDKALNIVFMLSIFYQKIKETPQLIKLQGFCMSVMLFYLVLSFFPVRYPTATPK